MLAGRDEAANQCSAVRLSPAASASSPSAKAFSEAAAAVLAERPRRDEFRWFGMDGQARVSPAAMTPARWCLQPAPSARHSSATSGLLWDPAAGEPTRMAKQWKPVDECWISGYSCILKFNYYIILPLSFLHLCSHASRGVRPWPCWRPRPNALCPICLQWWCVERRRWRWHSAPPPCCTRRSQRRRRAGSLDLGAIIAVGETVILLPPPLPSVGVSGGMKKGVEQNDSLADG